MVTQNGHRSVGTVVGENLCWDVVIRCEGREVVNKWVLQGVLSQAVSHSHCRTDLPLPRPFSTLHSNYSPKSLATSIPAPNSFWMLLITTDTISAQ